MPQFWRNMVRALTTGSCGWWSMQSITQAEAALVSASSKQIIGLLAREQGVSLLTDGFIDTWRVHEYWSVAMVRILLKPTNSYSAPSLESPLSVRATISIFQSAKNPNFNTVFAYWYSTTGGICNAPMCIDHLKFQILQSANFVRADYATRIAVKTCWFSSDVPLFHGQKV